MTIAVGLAMLVLVATGSGAVSSRAAPPQPDVARDLIGPVERVEVRETVLRDETEPREADADGAQLKERNVLRFDSGRLVEQQHFTGDDELQWRSVRVYDDEGNLVDLRGLDDEGRLEWRYEYVYDSTGRVIREVHYGAGEQIEQILLLEYHGGELAEEVVYGSDNAIRWRKSYDYDDDRAVKRSNVYHSDGTRIKQIRHEFDERGRIVEETHADQLGTAYERVEYTYDLFTEPVLVEIFDGQDNLKRRAEFELDARGNVSRERTVAPGEDAERIVVRDREYDDYGNWIRKRVTTEIVRGNSRRIVEERLVRRSIEYESQS